MTPTHAWPAVLLAAALTLAACSRPATTTVAAAAPDGEAFHQQVVDYLLRHPEVIDEAAGKVEQKRHALAMAASAKAIVLRRAALERDPRDYVANPEGKVTVVEFFDYRCPYCKAALPQLEALIRDNRDIRFVFKEYPIIPDQNGQIGVSLRAAEAALAARRAGKYLPVHDALMAAPDLDDAAIVRILRENGVDGAQAMPSAQDLDHLNDVRKLGLDIHAIGTPTFIVDGALVESSLPKLAAAIEQARKAAKS